MAMSFGLFAAPQGFRLISGDASAPLSTSPGAWEIQSVGSSIIQWDQFSIEADERVSFHQSAAGSGVLNRVVGGEVSRLFGMLSSNGPIYLINPQGVLIGPNGRVETAGFVASSLDVLDADFFQDKQHLFTAHTSSGSIINLGVIHCSSGDIALLGSQVGNEGDLKAEQGTVALGVGKEILLQFQQAPYLIIQVPISSNPQERGAALEHAGTIDALRVELRAASNVYAKAIQCSGTIEALGVERKGGEIYLIGQGGSCAVTGKIVAGQIASDKPVKGGFIEISGDHLDLKSEQLFGEKLLLDPTDIVISTGTDSGGSWSSCGFVPSANASVINTTTLQTLLGSCNVTISTASAFNGPQGGSITVSNPLTWSAATTLSLVADAGIAVTAPITNTASSGSFSAIQLTASGNNSTGGGYAGVLLTSNLVSQAGDIAVSGIGSPSGTSSHGVNLSNGHITAVDGNVSVIGVASGGHGIQMEMGASVAATGRGMLNLTGTTTISDTTFGCGILAMDSGTSITAQQGSIALTGSTRSTATLGASLYLAGNESSVTVSGAGAVTLTASNNKQIVLRKATISSASGALTMSGNVLNVNP